MRVLVLGGTAEARAVAARLAGRGDDVVSSLAGRVSAPALPVGEVRVGGFGGVAGLRDFVLAQGFSGVIDANPRRSFRSAVIRPSRASLVVDCRRGRPAGTERTTYGARPGSAGGS